MRIDELYTGATEPVFSFEFFPPKTEDGEANFWRALEELRPLDPAFVSVTYGAGGSTKDKTLELVSRIRNEFGIEAMAHFTCVSATVEQLREQLDAMRDAGIENVLALRGAGGGDRARAAGRPAGRSGGVDQDARRPGVLGRAGDDDPRVVPGVRHRRRLLPGDAHPRDLARGRPALPQGEGRSRRAVPDHAAVLRQRVLRR